MSEEGYNRESFEAMQKKHEEEVATFIEGAHSEALHENEKMSDELQKKGWDWVDGKYEGSEEIWPEKVGVSLPIKVPGGQFNGYKDTVQNFGGGFEVIKNPDNTFSTNYGNHSEDHDRGSKCEICNFRYRVRDIIGNNGFAKNISEDELKDIIRRINTIPKVHIDLKFDFK